MSDLPLFLRTWIRAPFSVGAIAPSSRALAEAITLELNAASGPVIELGPGTGAFTQCMLERGVAEEHLTLVESSPVFADLLRVRFPRANVLTMSATGLRHASRFSPERAGAVVSGLPLLSIPPAKVFAILFGAFRRLRPDGAFYLFTYGPRCPVASAMLDRLQLQAESCARVLANIPPARVYKISRRI